MTIIIAIIKIIRKTTYIFTWTDNNAIRMSFVCTRMSFVCYWYEILP